MSMPNVALSQAMLKLKSNHLEFTFLLKLLPAHLIRLPSTLHHREACHSRCSVAVHSDANTLSVGAHDFYHLLAGAVSCHVEHRQRLYSHRVLATCEPASPVP
jgi:hypothetical protein